MGLTGPVEPVGGSPHAGSVSSAEGTQCRWWSRDGIRCLLKNSHLIFDACTAAGGLGKRGHW